MIQLSLNQCTCVLANSNGMTSPVEHCSKRMRTTAAAPLPPTFLLGAVAGAVGGASAGGCGAGSASRAPALGPSPGPPSPCGPGTAGP